MRHLTHLKYIDVVARSGSIRKAAEQLNITSTALNRRILALEEEVGTSLFERLPSGVRLNTAGELFIQHIRLQMTDLSRVLSQIADLSGVRRGHVSLSANPELASSFLPEQIGIYRSQFDAVSFSMLVQSPADSLASLRDFQTDIALIFDSVLPSDVHIAATVEQQVHAFMHKSHPLADRPALRLEDCLAYAVMLPEHDSGLRALLEVGQMQSSISLSAALCSDNFDLLRSYACFEPAIGFCLPMSMHIKPGAGPADDLVCIPVASRDIPAGLVHLVQAKGRVLPVAAAKFLDQLVVTMNGRFPEQTR